MLYVKDLKDYDTLTARIQGLKKLVAVRLQTPWPIKTIVKEGFIDYKKAGKLPDILKQQIVKAFKEIRRQNPYRGVYAGRAYYVPGVDDPPGPRSSSVRTRQVILQEVKKLYDFAIESKYDQKENAEIGVIFYPFINPGDPSPDPKIPDLQYPGGCVAPGERNTAIIEAIYGADEGVQSFPHDTFVVDLEKAKIISRDIAHKTKSLRATNELTYETVKVLPEFRDKATLDDRTLLNLAQDFQKLTKRFGPHRVEYVLQPEGIVFRECVPFKMEKQEEISAQGAVEVVSCSKDIARLGKNAKIVFVDPVIIRERNMDLLTELAFETPHKLIVLFPGSATTAHAATLLRERGHKVIYIGQETFVPKEKVCIQAGIVVRVQ